MKKHLALIVMSCLFTTGCQKAFDSMMDNYMANKGDALLEAKFDKLLSERASGKRSASLESRTLQKVEIPVDGSPVMGDQAAKATIVSFLDVTDPFSQKVFENLQALMMDKNVSVRWVGKIYPTAKNDFSEQYAQGAATAAKMGKFWEFQRQSFSRQLDLDKQPTMAQIANDIGLDQKQFFTRIKGTDIKAMIEADQSWLNKNGGTAPAVFLNGVRLTDAEITPENLKKMIAK